MAEVQQTSDATFRLFDWDRRDAGGNKRKLHVDEALASIDWDKGPAEPIHVEMSSPGRVPLVESPYFELKHVCEILPFTLGGHGRLEVFCVLSGEARLASGLRLLAGQVWLLPAALAELTCHPEPAVGGLLCTLAS